MAKEITLNTLIQLRNDTAENWANAGENAKLQPGEAAVEIKNGKAKVKVGVEENQTFADAPYIGGEEAQLFTNSTPLAYDNTQDDVDEIIPTLIPEGTELHDGDIAIVKRYISGTNGSNPIAYTSYVYNNGDWQACDGNYSASNVFFKENITVTQTVGNISTSNNTPKEIPCAGKNIKELFEILYATEDLSLSSSDPSVSFTVSDNGSGEVGTTFTRPTATLKVTGLGSYEYGCKDSSGTKYGKTETGITFNALKIAGNATKANVDSKAEVDAATSSVSEKASGGYVTNEQVSYTATDTDIASNILTDSTVYYYFGSSADSTASARKPITNLGNFRKSSTESTTSYDEGTSALGTKTFHDVKTWSAVGYRKPFWGYKLEADALADPTAITSAQIRALGNSGSSAAGLPTTLEVPVGTKQVFFAAKKGTKTGLSITDDNALGAGVACTKMTKSVSVADARGNDAEGNPINPTDYDVWYVNLDGSFGKAGALVLKWS